MKEFWNFVVTYKAELVALVTIVVYIITAIVRKKPVKVVNNVFEYGLRLLPYLINKGEVSEYKGEDKLEYVFALLVQSFVDAGYEANLITQNRSYWLDRIEDVLSTPQKKEAKKDA